MSGVNYDLENFAAFMEGTEKEAKEFITVRVYGCGPTGANILNIRNCEGCSDLSPEPIEEIKVPRIVMAKGEDARYIGRVSRFERIIQSIRCPKRTEKPETK